MRKKELYRILTSLILVILLIMAMIFTGCALDQQLWDAREETRSNTEEPDVKEEQKEEIRAWEEDEKQSEEAATAEDGSLPSGTVTYNGNVDGLPIIFIVNFKTTEVTGSLGSPVEGLPDYVFTDGKVDLDTLKITARSTGARELDGDGNVILTQDFTITGTISGDLSTINGEIVNNFDESFEFIAAR